MGLVELKCFWGWQESSRSLKDCLKVLNHLVKDGKKPLTNNGGEGNLVANNCPKAGMKSTGSLLLDSKEASKCLRPFEALTLEGGSDSFS